MNDQYRLLVTGAAVCLSPAGAGILGPHSGRMMGVDAATDGQANTSVRPPPGGRRYAMFNRQIVIVAVVGLFSSAQADPIHVDDANGWQT